MSKRELKCAVLRNFRPVPTALPVALALIEHLNLSKDTAATVARSFLNDLETYLEFSHMVIDSPLFPQQ